jgi:acetyl esterase/lipase
MRTLITAAVGLGLSACGSGPSGEGGVGVPTPVASDRSFQRGISYSQSGQKLDLCRPADKAERQTALVFIHGGGFKSGSRKDMEGYCKLLAEGGFTAVTIDYRLSGEATYPAALDDTNAAIKWVKANAEAEGYDPKRIVLIGYSAGGSLALMAGRDEATEIAARISLAGISDFEAAMVETPHKALKRNLAAFLGGTDAKAISPVTLAQPGDAPVFLIHGETDRLVPISQSVRMAQVSAALGNKVLLKAVPDIGHEVFLPNPELADILGEMTAFVVAVDKAQ